MSAARKKPRPSPLQPRRTARPAPRLHAVAAALAALGLAGAAQAQNTTALPLDGRLVSGTATIASNAATMTITQTTSRAAIEWGSFNIGSQASVNHVVPNSSAITLHRVTGQGGTSLIDGVLSSNGRVFLVNTSGVVFSSTARVDVGALVASSRDLDPALTANNYAGFQAAGTLTFSQGTDLSDGTFGDKVTVDFGAQLTARPDGSIVLIGGREVAVAGTLAAARGNIALVAASSTTVDITDSGFVKLVAAAGNDTSALTSRGVSLTSATVAADNGRVQLLATGNADDQVAVTLRDTTVQALGSAGGQGQVHILASAGAEPAVIGLTGVDIDVSAQDAASTAGRIVVAGTQVSTSSPASESAAIAALEPGFANALRADGLSGGGLIEIGEVADPSGLGVDVALGNARSVRLDGSTFVSASAAAGGNGAGGQIRIVASHNQAPVETAPRPGVDFGVVEVSSSLVARGAGSGNGGVIQTRAPALGFDGASRIDAAAGTAGTTAGSWQVEAFDVRVADISVGAPDSASLQLGTNEINRALDNGTSVALTARAPDAATSANVVVQSGASVARSSGGVPVTLTLAASNDVILEAGSSFVSTSGALNVHLAANAGGGAGNGSVELQGLLDGGETSLPVTLTTRGGDLVIGGGADPTTGLAEGSGRNGVSISGARIDTRGTAGAGNISIRGRGGLLQGEGLVAAEGVSIVDSTLAGNDIRVLGAGSANHGVRIVNTALTTTNGAIDLRGTLEAALGSEALDAGVQLGTGTAVDLGTTGTLTVAGVAAPGLARNANLAGVSVDGVTVTGGSRVTLAGEGSTFGISQQGQAGLSIGGAQGAASTADVVLGGSAGAGAADRALNLPALQVNTTGRVNLSPLSVSVSTGEDGVPAIGIGAASEASILVGASATNDVDFLVQGQWLGGITADSFIRAADIMIGSSQHAGQIRVGSGAMSDAAAGTRITLQNQGEGSRGITFEGQAGGAGLAQLSLLTAGNISQGGSLKTGQLVIQGGPGSTVALQAEGNRIGSVSFDPPQTLLLSTSGDLVVNSGTARGFDAGNLAFTATTITRNEAGQTLQLRSTDGNLVLNASIAMTGPNASVDLIAGNTFRNTANAGIDAGLGGQWRIWSASLQGFQPGALAGVGRSVFNCDFGECEAPTGNLFLFAQGAPAFNLNDPGLFQDFRTHFFLEQQRSDIYGLNTPGRPQVCAAISTIRGITEADGPAEPLSVEWTRVRSQPHLSGCLDVRNDNACSGF